MYIYRLYIHFSVCFISHKLMIKDFVISFLNIFLLVFYIQNFSTYIVLLDTS